MKLTHIEERSQRVTRVDAVICDLCQCQYPDERWGVRLPHIEETTVRYTKGCADRDGGGWDETILFDICPACFLDRLVPWLEGQGATGTREESAS